MTAPGRRAVLAAGSVVVALLVALPGCSVAAQKEARMGEVKVATGLECVGRVCLRLPASFTRKGHAFKFGMVDLVEGRLPPGGEKAFQVAWGAKLASVAALRSASARPADPTGQVVWKGALGPDFEAVMYHHDSRKEDGLLAGLLARDQATLALETDLGFSYRENVVGRFNVIGKAWRPRREGEPWPIPGTKAFYLGSGAIVRPGYGGEEAMARFEEDASHARLLVSTEHVVEPEKRGLLARLGEASTRAGLSLSGAFSVVRSGERKAGGEKGDELILKVNEGKELSFAWTFPGEADEPERPEVVVKMETSSENQAEKLAAWDRTLDSLRWAARP